MLQCYTGGCKKKRVAIHEKKFASFVLLSVFTAGVTASSAVSASSNVDDAPVQVNDNANSGENIVSSNDSEGSNGLAENLDNKEENSAEKDNNLEEQDGENRDLVRTSKKKGPDSKKVLEIAGGVGGAAVGATCLAHGAKKIWGSKNKGRSKIDDNPTNTGTDTIPSQSEDVKKDKPGSGEENSGSGFAAWYKNNLGLSIPLSIVVVAMVAVVVLLICKNRYYVHACPSCGSRIGVSRKCHIMTAPRSVSVTCSFCKNPINTNFGPISSSERKKFLDQAVNNKLSRLFDD